MLNIELVRFEAQDVITASVATPACAHDGTWKLVIVGGKAQYDATCNKCGATGTGTEVVNGVPVIKWN